MAKKKKKSFRKHAAVQPVITKPRRHRQPLRVKPPAENNWESYLDKTLYYGMLVLAFLLPLIFERYTYDQFDLPKMVFLRAMTIFLLCVFLLKLLLSKKIEIQFSPVLFLVVLFLASVFVSTVLSVHVPTAVFGKYRRYEGFLTFFTYGIIFFLTLQVFRDFSRIRSLAEVMVVSAAIASFYGIMQFFGLDPLKWAEVPFELRRSFSTYGNPTLLAGYLVISFPLSLAIFLSAKERWETVSYGIFTLMIFFCILTAFTRASWLGILVQIIAAAFLFPYLYLLFKRSLAGKEQRIVTILYMVSGVFLVTLFVLLLLRLIGKSEVLGYSWNMSVAIIAGIFAVFYVPSFVFLLAKYYRAAALRTLAMSLSAALLLIGVNFYTMQSSKSPMSLMNRAQSVAQVEAGSAGTRVEIWTAAIKMVKDRPVFGFGPDTFRLVSRMYQTKIYARVSQFTVADNAHNYILQIASGTGLAGLAFFLLLIFAFAFSGFTALRKTENLEEFLIYTALIIAVLGYLVHLIFSVSVVGGSTFLWLILGVIVARSQFKNPYSISFDPSSLWVRSLISVIIVFFALVGIKYHLDIYYADIYFVDASRLVQSGLFEQGVEAYNTAIALFPYMDRYQADLGVLYERAYEQSKDPKFLDLSIKYLKRANRTSPLETDNIIFLGNAYMMKSQADPKYYPQTIEIIKKSVKIAPYLANGHLLLGICYLETKKLDLALKELKLAVDFNPKSIDGLAALGETYEQMGDKEKALKSYKAALKINPDFPKAKAGYERLKNQ